VWASASEELPSPLSETCPHWTTPPSPWLWTSFMDAWTSAAGGPWPSLDFQRGTNIVDRGLKVLFFGLFLLFFGHFSVGPLWKRLNSAIFGIFANFWSFFRCPSGKLSTDALVWTALKGTSFLSYDPTHSCWRKYVFGKMCPFGKIVIRVMQLWRRPAMVAFLIGNSIFSIWQQNRP